MTLVGIEIGRRHHPQHFAAIDVDHDAAGGAGGEGLARGFHFMRQDVLHPHVDGGGDLAAGRGADLFFQTQFQAGKAIVVGIGDTHHLGGHAAVGIVTLAARLELQPGSPRCITRASVSGVIWRATST